MGKLTPQGYVADQMDDIFDEFVKGLKGIYGDDILVDADDPDGEFAGILAQMRADVEGVILAIYQANDPDNATGVWLEQKVAYAGVERRDASYSYLRDAQIDGDAGKIIKAGFIVKDPTGIQWITETDATIGSDNTVLHDFRSQDPGQFVVAAGVSLDIVTITSGVDSAKTTEQSELGYEEETDPQLLSRFYKSRSKPSQNAVDGTVGDIFAIMGVIDVVALENYSDSVDENDVAPHTVNYVVDGGDQNAIAQAIYNNWPGTGLQGAVSVQVVRPRSGRTVNILFDRPMAIDMAAQITVGRRKNFTSIDTAGIQSNVTSMVFGIGESVYQDDIVDEIKKTPGCYVKSILYGRKGSTLTDTPVVQMGAVEKPRFLSGDVAVTVTDE
ncbi:baseplate J/gp47 family protein [Lelliottia wanjuensis]|uniref:baseplate J/gp47 family protein n=1 Tax=Lelliottia wanjuensis TaxID=3050585 RepID=UPI00254B411A|nr:baseplate J/gp47 family protein [Lelliottia sp. V104_15]MDK9607120.1 baseplate J/gp47 family protein [Lelliottia sp. V104_15]